MSIMGNVVGVTAPRADWTQTDETRGDFIRNKPDITALEEKAVQALTLARGALPLAGGTMAGEIAMGGFRLTGLAEPVLEGDAVTKAYADSAGSKKFTLELSLPADGWTGESGGPYTQGLYAQAVLETDRPHFGPVYSGDRDARLAQKAAFSCLDELDTENGYLVFTCLEEKPTADVTVQLEVIR